MVLSVKALLCRARVMPMLALLVLMRVLLAVLLAIRVDQPEIVFRVLIEVLCRDAVAGCSGITCQGQILLQNLISVAADTDVGPAAVEGL